MDDRIALPDLARELEQQYPGTRSPPYWRLHEFAASNRFPAEHSKGRWRVRREDLPAIALALGMTEMDRMRA